VRLEFLTIDHVGGGGNLHRRTEVGARSIYLWLHGAGYPSGFRTLCWNCNAAHAFHGYCPHQGTWPDPLESQFVGELTNAHALELDTLALVAAARGWATSAELGEEVGLTAAQAGGRLRALACVGLAESQRPTVSPRAMKDRLAWSVTAAGAAFLREHRLRLDALVNGAT
jgi:hypothetical protein